MSEFCKTYNLQNLVRDPTCYENPSKPTCIDLILTNFPKSFQHTQTIETGLPDFHKLTWTVLKTHFPRLKPNIVNYKDYEGFVNDYFRSELLQDINSSDSDLSKNFKKKKKNFMTLFYGWGSTASSLEPLRVGSLLFTTKFPEISGTHFIDLGRMNGWVGLGPTHWLWTRDPWIGNPAH